jgi:diaminopimelate decarboxylase
VFGLVVQDIAATITKLILRPIFRSLSAGLLSVGSRVIIWYLCRQPGEAVTQCGAEGSRGFTKKNGDHMNDVFRYANGRLHCETIPLADIAAAVGTPTYVYSRVALLARAEAVKQAIAVHAPDGLVCYAVKANGSPALLRLLAQAGLGADVTSGGELFLARHAGFPPQRTLFSGVGKSAAEIRDAIAANIRAIHLESAMEMEVVAQAAQTVGRPAAVGVRVNPGIEAATHPHISTGGQAHKFGVSPDQALALLRQAARHPWLRPVGLAVHIGSQITELAPFAAAAQQLVALAQEMEKLGTWLDYLDAGGGLGVAYETAVPDPSEWIKAVAQPIRAAGYQLVVEPGRSLVADCGMLLTRVLYLKRQREKQFVVVDAGMTDLLRPALYDAHHPILPVAESDDAKTQLVDVVGPICETGDYLARERPLPPLQSGDLLAITQAGAYGFAMSSNYNGRLRPAEVLVNGEQFRIIRRRQEYADLLPDVAPAHFGRDG